MATDKVNGSIPSTLKIQDFGPSVFLNNSEQWPSFGYLLLKRWKRHCFRIKEVQGAQYFYYCAIVAAALILAGVYLVSLMNIRAQSKNRGEQPLVVESSPMVSTESSVIIGKLVLFSENLPSKYGDWEAGTKALLDRENSISGTSIGTVYRTNLEGGISITLKKLETLGRIRSQDEFD